MNYFLHRISYYEEIARPLLENKGILTIGFSHMIPFFEQLRIGEIDAPFKNDGYYPRNRWTLWRLIYEMRIGDIVVVPGRGNFSVFKIESDALPIGQLPIEDVREATGDSQYNIQNGRLVDGDAKEIDLGFFRRVSTIKENISRYDFADAALTSRLKIRQTNANITDLTDDVNKAINAYRRGERINIRRMILDVAIEKIHSQFREQLNPDKWESLIRKFFEKSGASKVEIPPKNKSEKVGDADIVAIFEPLKTVYYVQAKFHDGNTCDDFCVRQIDEYRDQPNQLFDGYTAISWVVSSCKDFSPEVKSAAEKSNVMLINGGEFTEMLLNVGILGLEEI